MAAGALLHGELKALARLAQWAMPVCMPCSIARTCGASHTLCMLLLSDALLCYSCVLHLHAQKLAACPAGLSYCFLQQFLICLALLLLPPAPVACCPASSSRH